jgi:hypothetical protein
MMHCYHHLVSSPYTSAGKFMLPKRRFWKAEPTFQNAFSNPFSTVWAPDLGHKRLKSASKITPPKRRFWKNEQKMKCGFSSTFQGREYSIWATNRGKVLPSKSAFHLLFILPKSSFGEHKNALWMVGSDFHNLRLGGVKFERHVGDITMWRGRYARSLRTGMRPLTLAGIPPFSHLLAHTLFHTDWYAHSRLTHTDSRTVVSSTDTSACYLLLVSSTATSACYLHLVSSTDTSTSCESDRNIGILFILWVRQTHWHAIFILWVRQTHRHAIFILWVRQTHQHAIIFLWVRQTHQHAIIFLWVRQTHRHLGIRQTHRHSFHLVSLTDTSACYLQLVSLTDTSACYLHLVSSTDTSAMNRHAIIILWVRQTHRQWIGMLSSSCEFDRHINMLSSSCEFDTMWRA